MTPNLEGELVDVPVELSRVMDFVRHDVPDVKITPDGPFIKGGFMIDFRWRELWVNIEWQPTARQSFGVSLVTEDSAFTCPDEWISGELEAARKIANLLRQQ
jgi:hypothetical protein